MPKRRAKPDRSKRRTTTHAPRRSRAAPAAADRGLAPEADPTPSWDAKEHTLTWQGRVVKHFKGDAPSQEAILAGFQAAGWPHCILAASVMPAATRTKRLLRATVENLTRSVEPALRFGLEGNGTRICWKVGKSFTATLLQEKD